MELSQNKLKYLVSLQQKKFREEHKLFIAEGVKVINDLIHFGMTPVMMAYNPQIHQLSDFGQTHAFCEYYTTTAIQDKKFSQLSTAPGVIAVFQTPEIPGKLNTQNDRYVFLLDNLQDPGNLGTIIRTAHWFGITDLYITKGSVELYNPKVIQSSMGSIAAVKVHVVDSEGFNNELSEQGIVVYTTHMEGKPVTSDLLKNKVCIVLGNESHGVSEYWKAASTGKLSIPPADPHNKPDSLNVATSAAIFMQLLTASNQ